MTENISDLCFLARTALDIDRYDDVIIYVQKIIEINPNLDHGQRILFSQAYHESVSKRRNDIAVLVGCRDASTDSQAKKKLDEFITKLRNEIHDIVTAVCAIIDGTLLPNSESKITDLFYHKMKADYYRYDAENQVGQIRDYSIQKAEESYTVAIAIAQENVSPGHPVFLGVILNFCVFLVDIKDNKPMACEIAAKAIQSAKEANAGKPEFESDSEICIRLLQDNIELWEDGAAEDEQ